MGTHCYGLTEVETAATCTEELPYLVRITANQLDEQAKLDYAAWLDARADPRGVFLRDFIRRANIPGALLPGGDEFPLPWRLVTGIRPLQRLREYIYYDAFPGAPASFEADLMQGLRPTLDLYVTPANDEDLPPGSTKCGGRPDLLPGVSWVTQIYHAGNEVGVFCAQIRFSDLRGTLVGQELPSEGLLSFFEGEIDLPCRFQPEHGPFLRPDPPNRDLETRGNEF